MSKSIAKRTRSQTNKAAINITRMADYVTRRPQNAVSYSMNQYEYALTTGNEAYPRILEQTRDEIVKNAESRIIDQIVFKAEEEKLLDPESDDHFVSNFTGFAVRIRLNRRGLKELSSVSMVGRVPTNYYDSNGQGPHIVANGFCLLALESLLEFKPFDKAIDNLIEFANAIPEQDEKINRKVWKVYDGIVEDKNATFTKEKIIASLQTLKARANRNLSIFDGQTKIGNLEAVRQNQSLLRTDLAFMTSNVVRLWNKKRGTVWDEKGTDPTYFEQEAFATQLNGGANERAALQYLRDVKLKNVEEPTEADLITSIVYLIDIRPRKSVKRPKGKKVPSLEALKDVYDVYFNAAFSEASRLFGYVLPGLILDENKIKDAIEERVWTKDLRKPPKT